MEPTPNSRDKSSNQSSRFLFFIMVALIVAAFAAFLVLRPNPSGVAPNSKASPSSQQ